RVAEQLMSEQMYSGWGTRTVAISEVRYNPMSYHDGSVWPHDNALIALGFQKYGFNDLAANILKGLFESSLYFDFHRLPELFCGFHRREGEGPTQYPVACSPQSWSAASIFLILQACLGMTVLSSERQVIFQNPILPEFLDKVRIERL